MPRAQHYNNHRRFYPLHHFFIAPLSLLILVSSIYFAVQNNGSIWTSILAVLIGIFVVALPLLIRIYALKNQDRIIRLEMRQRYFELTGQRFLEKEKQLQKGQLIALRFASDDELELLIDKAIDEQLNTKEIKQSIKNWQADYWRV